MTRFRRIAVLVLALMGGRPGLLRGQAAGGGARSSQSRGAPVTPTAAGDAAPVEVTGRVLNGRTRQPVARALVQFGGRRVLTDHDGLFHFPAVTATSGSLSVSKTGFVSTGEEAPRVYRFSGDAPIELTLYPEAILFGSVIDSTGEPVPHLQLMAMRSTYNDTGHHWFFAGRSQTLSDGSYRLSLPAGDYALQARATARPLAGGEMIQPVTIPANPSSIRQAIHLAPGDEVRLDPRPSVRQTYGVTLRMEGGLEHGFPMLTARPVNGTAVTLPATPDRADRNTFHLALPNGTYELTAEMQNQEGRAQGRTAVTVAGRDVAGVTLALTPVPMFPVVVEVDSSATLDTAIPVPKPQQLGLLLTSVANTVEFNDPVFTIASHGPAAPSFSLPDGIYRLHASSGTGWYVTAASCGGTDLLQQNLTVAPGSGGAEMRIRVSNRTVDVTGTVRVGDAPGGAWIYLIATAPSPTPIISFRAGSLGTFTRPYVAPGTYRVVAAEQQITADLQNPETMNRFGARVQTLVVNTGDHPVWNLDAVPAAELGP